jgi:hypothetical protein
MPLVISLRSHTREAGFVSGNAPRVIDGAAEIRFGAAPEVDLGDRNSHKWKGRRLHGMPCA